ncbi:MAG: hypothetical protein PHS49_04900 [Candidatus Gracilibacteria bacterium]|nr:hypothetical protein [Candidatus Gracilibacteria bacterium]
MNIRFLRHKNQIKVYYGKLLNYLKNLYKILKNKKIDPIIAFLLIGLVWTIILIIIMKEYMIYVNIKYSSNSIINSNYTYNYDNTDEQIEASNLNSAMDEDPNNVVEIILSNYMNGKMTTWGGETDKYPDEINLASINESIENIYTENIDAEFINTKFEIKNIEVETIAEKIQLKENEFVIDYKKNDEDVKNTINIQEKKESVIKNDIIVKVDNTIIKNDVSKSNNIIINNDTIVKGENIVIKNDTSKSNNTIVNNDALSISISNEINNQLGKLNTNLFDGFQIKVLNNRNLLLENGVWYTYVFSKYQGFGKGIVPSESELKNEGIDRKSTVLLIDNNTGINFVIDYKKVKLISDNIITNISNKEEFLTELADDKKYLYDDTDEIFLKLKNETINITKGLNDSKKIQKIYDFILKNVNYSKVFNINNKYIFSGIYTYKNNDGICSGYSKLYLYMLSFAGINDVKVLKGNVIDAPDFPNIGHAWLKIGGLYYDPTFDDPIGNTSPKKYEEYKYFGLPKDLFYTNRFDYGSLPGDLKVANLDTRKSYIHNKLSGLYYKYADNNYNLLKSIGFNKKYGLSETEKMTIEKLKELVPNFEANDYKYVDNGVEIEINDIDYHTITDTNIDTVLEKIGYDLNGIKLFKWDNGTYRLAYKVS